MIVGIDPGLDGALFFFDPGAPTCGDAVDVSVHVLARGGAKRREIDIAGLVQLLSRPLDHAFLEQAQAMPKQGVASTFAFGKGFGVMLGGSPRNRSRRLWCRLRSGSEPWGCRRRRTGRGRGQASCCRRPPGSGH
jgi:hypothetical protein